MTTNLTTITTTAVQIATIDGDEQLDLAAEFGYDPTDPWAVTMRVASRAGEVAWTFAREILLEGQYEPAGDGDVHIWPCLSPSGEAVVIVELTSPTGGTLLQFPSRDVQDFLNATLRAVPSGEEQVDVDTWLDQIMGAV